MSGRNGGVFSSKSAKGGDACLKSIAEGLKPLTDKPGKVLARYGGEKFIVLLPSTDSEGARLAAEGIKKRIEELRIPHKASKVNDCVTVSIGVASIFRLRGSSGTRWSSMRIKRYTKRSLRDVTGSMKTLSFRYKVRSKLLYEMLSIDKTYRHLRKGSFLRDG